MKTAEKQDLRQFYDRVGTLMGWNFSNLNVEVEGDMGDFYTEVATQCTPNSILLDIGTGGGERIAEIANQTRLAIGIDHSDSMIQMAQQKHPLNQYGNMRFLRMEADQLIFPSQFFDVISCRQSSFNAQQVAMVLANGGYFLTQQVSEGDKLNLKQAFKRGQEYGVADGEALEQYIIDLNQAGLTNLTATEYDSIEYYQTPDDLIFLLKHTPIIPNFGDQEDDFEILADFIDKNSSPKGIKMNSKRYRIVAHR